MIVFMFVPGMPSWIRENFLAHFTQKIWKIRCFSHCKKCAIALFFDIDFKRFHLFKIHDIVYIFIIGEIARNFASWCFILFCLFICICVNAFYVVCCIGAWRSVAVVVMMAMFSSIRKTVLSHRWNWEYVHVFDGSKRFKHTAQKFLWLKGSLTFCCCCCLFRFVSFITS